MWNSRIFYSFLFSVVDCWKRFPCSINELLRYCVVCAILFWDNLEISVSGWKKCTFHTFCAMHFVKAKTLLKQPKIYGVGVVMAQMQTSNAGCLRVVCQTWKRYPEPIIGSLWHRLSLRENGWQSTRELSKKMSCSHTNVVNCLKSLRAIQELELGYFMKSLNPTKNNNLKLHLNGSRPFLNVTRQQWLIFAQNCHRECLYVGMDQMSERMDPEKKAKGLGHLRSSFNKKLTFAFGVTAKAWST